MSTIPPNWMASVLGGLDTQKQAAAAKNKEAADQAEHTGTAKFAERLQAVIENSDRDGEVYADAEGLGSQGRAPSDAPEEQDSAECDASDSAEGGLDIQA